MKVSISRGNSKMGAVHSVSLPLSTCPPDVPCHPDHCKGGLVCYGKKAWFPSLHRALARNLKIWRSDPDDYFGQIGDHIAGHGVDLFRWHVYGDIPTAGYLRGMLDIAAAFPRVRFVCFSKNLVSLGFVVVIEDMENLQLIQSLWPPELVPPGCTWNNEPIPGLRHAWIAGDPRASGRPCSGQCDACAHCFRPGGDVVLQPH